MIVPLAIIGVTIGLLFTGIAMEFIAILGVLSLSGLLIKNAIVLVDQMDIEIGEGKPRFDAIIEAAYDRARPVILSSLTTVLGVPAVRRLFKARPWSWPSGWPSGRY